MSRYIIPIVILLLIVACAIKKVDIYDCFIVGAKDGIKLIGSILPYIVSIFILISLLRATNLSAYLATLLSPLFNLLGIPPSVCELIILRPLSGNGSLAILNELYVEYGADSYIARVASVIMGASETIMYVASIYMSKSKVKKLGGGIPISLFASFVGVIMASFLCRLM